MPYLDDESGNYLVTDGNQRLVTDDEPMVLRFPLMLMMRLRIHAAWLLFMLIPGF